jgi:3D (Asp-Asp-Asp) domain-containing protein
MKKESLTFFTIILMVCVSVFVSDTHIEEEKHFTDLSIKDFPVPLPDCKMIQTEPEEEKIIPNILDMIEGSTVTVTVMKKESLGWYFVTAYCPSECGYNGSNYPTGWTTATGEICHRADYEDRLTEPTTCAISRSIHSFGELFYIEEFDRVFISEDTGPGVQGKHLDLFYEEYADVISFPTGWYEVFSVEYEEVTVKIGDN